MSRNQAYQIGQELTLPIEIKLASEYLKSFYVFHVLSRTK